MVTPSSSRPATLSQRQVDDLARGQPGEAASLLRAARFEMTGAEPKATTSGPVPMEAKEIQAIARSGVAPDVVLKRIAAATAPEKQKQTAAPAHPPGGTAPTLKPPESSERS